MEFVVSLSPEDGMKVGRKVVGLLALMPIIGGAGAMVYEIHFRERWRPISLQGAVIQQDADPRKELPIANVEVSAANGMAQGDSKSDSSGYFQLTLRRVVKPGQTVALTFTHPGFTPLEMNVAANGTIYVARMEAIPRQVKLMEGQTEVSVGNVRVRYSIKAMAEMNVGSVVRDFEVSNKGGVPCYDRKPCSPDGKWKATRGSISLDAGHSNQFRSARISCIAGPCPFTNIRPIVSSADGQTIEISALAWSDTATFLVEAEVVHPVVNNLVRYSYPVTFGEALNFTLPGESEGVSVEAELNKTPIVFPLGPDLFLSWADCNARVNPDHTKVYRCELKAGYRFQ
jgi:hypothetical protein